MPQTDCTDLRRSGRRANAAAAPSAPTSPAPSSKAPTSAMASPVAPKPPAAAAAAAQLARAESIAQVGAAPDASRIASLEAELAIARADARADQEAKARLEEQCKGAVDAKAMAERMAEMQAEMTARDHKQSTDRALADLRAEADAKAEQARIASDAIKKELEARNQQLLDEAARLKAQLEAAQAPKGKKRARARATEAPEGASAERMAERMGMEAGAPATKRPAKGPFPDFIGPQREWSVQGSGAEAFLGFLGITGDLTKVDDKGRIVDLINFFHEVRWPLQALRFRGASYNRGLDEGAVANFEAALRTMAGAGPWTIDGVEYKSRTMWFMANGWPELGITHVTDKLEDTPLNQKAYTQMKKVRCGVDLLVQAYNKWMLEVIKKPDWTPIARTKENHEATRNEKKMKALVMIEDKVKRDAGHVALVGVLTHGAPAPAPAPEAQGEPTGLDALQDVEPAVPSLAD